MKRLLKALAGSSAFLERDGKDEGSWVLVRGGAARPEVVEENLIARLTADDFLQADRTGRMHLTETGRKSLKRWLSAGDGFQEQHREIAGAVDPGAVGNRRIAVNLKESPLAWLASRRDRRGRRILDISQVQAGERLRADYGFACLMPSTGRGWSVSEIRMSGPARGTRADLSDDVIAARQRIERTLSGLEPALATVLVDVCCHLKGLEAVEAERGWPARSAKVVLQIALSSLARRYGYGPVAGPDNGPIRTWQKRD